MRTYEKPSMLVERFRANVAVAKCSETTSYNNQSVTVHCVINGTHEVFWSNCESNYNNMRTVNYDGTYYILWYDSSVSRGSAIEEIGLDAVSAVEASSEVAVEIVETYDINDTLIKAIQAVAGVSGSGWHAAPVSPNISTVVNMS